MEINYTDYKIEDKFYHKVETKKRKIVLTETGFDKMKHLYRLSINDYEPLKNTPHFTIDEKGIIYQHFDTEYYSKFIDDPKVYEVNEQSIIISMVNLGWLTYLIGKENPINWSGIEVKTQKRIFEYNGNFRNCTFFHTYTKKQIKSCADLCLFLLEKHNIKKEFTSHPFLMDDNTQLLEFEGICSRSNLSNSYKDVSPAFDFVNFSKLIGK